MAEQANFECWIVDLNRAQRWSLGPLLFYAEVSSLFLLLQITREFGFDFLNGGEAALEFRREGLSELRFPIRDGDGLLKAAEGILDEHLVFSLA